MDTIIEILIDYSQSMGISLDDKTGKNTFALSDGSTKMSVVKKILINDIIPTIDYASVINIRTFRLIESSPEIHLIYSDRYDQESIKSKIEEINDPTSGKTPITAAIDEASNYLKKYPDSDKKIFLFTDGQENVKGGDYKTAIKKVIETDKTPCQVFIIGINQNSEAEDKAKEIAEISGGMYIHLKQKNYDQNYVSSKLSSIKANAISGSISVITNSQKQRHPETAVITAQKNISSNSNQKIETQNESIAEIKEEPAQNHAEEIKQTDTQEEIPNKAYTDALNLINKQLLHLSSEIESINGSQTELSEVFEEDRELNEKVRIASEKLVYETLQKNYPERVNWLNEDKENYNPYDFEILNQDNSVEYYIECKATKNEESVFIMTAKEWSHFRNNTYNYQVYFVLDALTNPRIIKIDNLLDWLLKGHVVPYSKRSVAQKPERILMTIIKK